MSCDPSNDCEQCAKHSAKETLSTGRVGCADGHAAYKHVRQKSPFTTPVEIKFSGVVNEREHGPQNRAQADLDCESDVFSAQEAKRSPQVRIIFSPSVFRGALSLGDRVHAWRRDDNGHSSGGIGLAQQLLFFCKWCQSRFYRMVGLYSVPSLELLLVDEGRFPPLHQKRSQCQDLRLCSITS